MKKYLLIGAAGLLTTLAVTATVLNDKKPVAKKTPKCAKMATRKCTKANMANCTKMNTAACPKGAKADVAKMERTHCFD